MSPSSPENDPVHKGLHDLGRQIEKAETDDMAPGAAEPPAAEPPAPEPEPGTAEVEPGTAEVAAGGPNAGEADDDSDEVHMEAVPPADPNNPVERGLGELGRKIAAAEAIAGAAAGAGAAAAADDGDAAADDGKDGKRRAAHAAPKRRRSRKRTVAWIAGTFFTVLVLLAGAAAGYGWYLNHEIHRIDLKNLTSSPAKGADAGTENILMIGSTDRCALKVQNPAYGLCSQGVNGVNSDVVMILHLNPANGSLSILSIPRDLFIPNARAEGANKIDAGLYEGADQLINSIEEDFGIPIQHFVELNFDSFINVVNALGGVKMYFPEPVFDAYSGLNIQTTGCLTLNGTQALQVVRARHLQYKGPGVTTTDPNYWPYENQSDLARIRRDHEFLRVLATAVKAKGLGNPLTDQSLVAGVVGQLTVDSGLSATDMISLVLTFHGVNVNSSPQLTLPVAVDQFGNYVYKGGSYGDIEFPAEPQDHSAIDQFLGLKPGDDTYAGGALPTPSTVTVSVENGSGATNQAADTADSLKALGFQIGTIGDTTPVGQEAETVVYYSSKTSANIAAAQAVANSMSGAVIMADDPAQVQPGSQITVVTGTDFSVNPPPTTATTGTTGAGGAPVAGSTGTASSGTTTTTTSSSSSSSTQAFQPPTPTVSPLQPWDPRSCTASGGEGT
jgi:LCP family protein required for cell wall assembly